MILEKRSTKLILAIHDYQRHKGGHGVISRLACAWAKIRYELWTILTGSDINRDAQIARSVRLPHPNGVVVHRDAVIGENCLVMQQVTIGQTGVNGAPVIGRDSYIGAGAKVLGPIKVGQRARIGANAVVLSDVPDDCIAVGVPARIIIRDT